MLLSNPDVYANSNRGQKEPSSVPEKLDLAYRANHCGEVENAVQACVPTFLHEFRAQCFCSELWTSTTIVSSS